MNKLFDYIKNLRYAYWKRRLEGNWYFSDAVYYRDAKKIQKTQVESCTQPGFLCNVR